MNSLADLRRQFVGRTIRVIRIFGSADPVPPGSLGKVESIDDAAVMHVRWNGGQQHGVIVGEDWFELADAESPQAGSLDACIPDPIVTKKQGAPK